ncbi:MAG: hypothetical protein ACM37W_12365 [Actinomycetota bacterium]
MSTQFPARSKSLKVLASLLGILGATSLFSLPAFSQNTSSPSDAHTLPRGTTDAPSPTTGDSNNIYPVNQDSPGRSNTNDRMMPDSRMPESDNTSETEMRPNVNNETNMGQESKETDSIINNSITPNTYPPRNPNLPPLKRDSDAR